MDSFLEQCWYARDIIHTLLNGLQTTGGTTHEKETRNPDAEV